MELRNPGGSINSVHFNPDFFGSFGCFDLSALTPAAVCCAGPTAIRPRRDVKLLSLYVQDTITKGKLVVQPRTCAATSTMA